MRPLVCSALYWAKSASLHIREPSRTLRLSQPSALAYPGLASEARSRAFAHATQPPSSWILAPGSFFPELLELLRLLHFIALFTPWRQKQEAAAQALL
jgi:hypothetical protein